jgi:potassium channel subfamily K
MLGESNWQNDDRDGDHHRENDIESVTQRISGNPANIDEQGMERECRIGDKKTVLESRRHYHCMLITEIQSVMRHLNSSPPRKYTFDEWAWYLKLIGEDDSLSATKQALSKPKVDGVDGEGPGSSSTTNRNKRYNEDFKWSWVGSRSPLMGNKEEAQWVLEKLTKTLDYELFTIREEELEAEKYL